MMQSIKRATDMSPFPLVPPYVHTLQSEVEQEQRPSGNGDREAILVGVGLCSVYVFDLIAAGLMESDLTVKCNFQI